MRWQRLAAGAVAAILLGACAARRPLAPAPPVSQTELPFLASPLEGYPLTVDRERGLRVTDAYTALLDRGDGAATQAAAMRLLADDPGFHPAAVLAAQASFVRHDPAAAVERLRPVIAELPAYTAAALLLGRAAEQLPDLSLAFRAYTGVAAISPLATARAADVLPGALQQLSAAVTDALARGRLDDADAALQLLRAWAKTAQPTLVAARAVAVARGDNVAELVAVRELASRAPEDRGLAERRADLEVLVGDPKAGMQLLERLLSANPGDLRLQEKLAGARFRWRMQLLPARVRDVAAKAQISRGELALLLYWLLPDVRYGQAASARIATDVLDHPYREEIVRVVNLGLLDVDETLHRFGAERPAGRPEAAAAVLRLLARDRRSACLARTEPGAIGRDVACDLALRCGLLAEGGECLAGLPLSGAGAVDLIRRAVDQLGQK